MAAILIERETIEREEFEALLGGTPAEEVFAAKDQKARQDKEHEAGRHSHPKPHLPPRRPQIGAPAPAAPTP